MTQRSMSASMLTEIALSKNSPFHLYELYFDSGTSRFTDAGLDVTWSGNTYVNSGQVIGFEPIEENVSFNVTYVDIHLSGVPSAIISSFLNEQLLDRRAVIRKGFFNSNMAIIADPIIIFEGRMDSANLSEDPVSGTANIVITAASHFVDFEATNGRRTNATEQKALFSGDKAFDFIPSLAHKVLLWGKR